uniref:Uncharacterized protein n=1 Tax=viral metagenome TaxID=1070528 RepID=A0A6C0JPU5_9ZZZZ
MRTNVFYVFFIMDDFIFGGYWKINKIINKIINKKINKK